MPHITDSKNIFRLTGNRIGKKLSYWERFSLICALNIHKSMPTLSEFIRYVYWYDIYFFLSVTCYLISYDERWKKSRTIVIYTQIYIFERLVHFMSTMIIVFRPKFFFSIFQQALKYPSSFSFISKGTGFGFSYQEIAQSQG